MSNTDVLLSFIIPVYNGVSNGLDICLESIWSQNLPYGSYEVICIDDCSVDHSVAFIQEQQRLHENLKLIQNDCNIRQGGCKNKGIRSARGKYILFIDQDDYYHPDSVTAVLDHIKKYELDILICNNMWQKKGKSSGWIQLNVKNTQIYNSGREYVQDNGFTIAPWRMICRLDFLLDNELFFVEKTRIEDIDWGCKTILSAKKLQYQPILLLHYNRYAEQTTSLMKNNISVLKDQFWVARRVFQYAVTVKPSFKKINDLYLHHFKVAVRMLLGCYGSIKEKTEIIETYCGNMKTEDKILNLIITHPRQYAVVSNICIPFYRILMFLINLYRWHIVWRNK